MNESTKDIVMFMVQKCFPATSWPAMILGLFLCLSFLGSSCAVSGQKTGPHVVLEQYIAAIKANKPGDAYRLLSESVRRSLSESEFISRWKDLGPELASQAKEIEKRAAKPIKLRAKLEYPSGLQTKLIRHKEGWKLEEGVTVALRTATPVDTLRAFIHAVEQRDYQSVMKLISKPVRETIEKDINERMSKLKQSLGLEIEVKRNTAILQYDPRFKIELIKDGGQWKIKDFD